MCSRQASRVDPARPYAPGIVPTLTAADHDVVRFVECHWLDAAVKRYAYYLRELIDRGDAG